MNTDKGEKVAEVKLSTGRFYLDVRGVAVAMEGDPCRDPALLDTRWTEGSLKAAADRINRP